MPCEQVLAVSCTRLKKLGLPKHIPTSCTPVQAKGHLRFLQVSGDNKGAATRAKQVKSQ